MKAELPENGLWAPLIRPPLFRSRRKPHIFPVTIRTLVAATLVCIIFSTLSSHNNDPSHDFPNIPNIPNIQQCAIDNLHANLSFLDSARPVTAQEFIARRNRVAHALVASNVDAFALEPGYSFQYYGNISQHDWEPWEPEERPFIMLIEPRVNATTGLITAKTSFLSPHFEEGRARMLGIPADGRLDIVTWEEHWNPYDTLRKELFGGRAGVKIMVDEEMRDFLVRGLEASGFKTIGLSGEVEAVRQIKSEVEVELLRAVNTGTVQAVRAMRPCLTENEVATVLDNSLLSIGFSLFFNIVLFEENGALPHGGFITGEKVLEEDSMVLIDVGAHYQGYSSDICRSFFIDPLPRKKFTLNNIFPFLRTLRPAVRVSPPTNSSLHAEKLRVWWTVLEAQTASSMMFKQNNSAASVDVAARSVIADAGYEKMFTHRVGHGIGIKAHESPYLHKGNTGTFLRPGMTFTSEPGVYLKSKFGVRHEDVYLIKETGDAEALSGTPAKGPYEP